MKALKNKKLLNMRGSYKCTIIVVLEGDGTKDSPYEEVRYVMVNGEIVGKIMSIYDFPHNN
jgi:hypothetical protein